MVSEPERESFGQRPAEVSRLVERDEFATIFRAWVSRIGQAIPTVAPPGVAPSSGSPASKAGGPSWALVGVKRRGAILARRLWNELQPRLGPLLYGEVDISLYRDDYHLQATTPRVLGTEIDFNVDGKSILLVDDVLYTGRTVRAAMDLILDFGRPRVISLAVFVDRGHRELPIAANFVGTELVTAREDLVRVRLDELSETDGVELIRMPRGEAESGRVPIGR